MVEVLEVLERVDFYTASASSPTALARAQNVEFISLNEKSHLKVDLNCCLCNVHMTNIHETHNPYPLRPDTEDSRCCAKCNEALVIPARIESLISKKKSMQT